MEGLLRISSVSPEMVLLVHLLLLLLHVDQELLLGLQLSKIGRLLRIGDVALYAIGLVDSHGHTTLLVVEVQPVRACHVNCLVWEHLNCFASEMGSDRFRYLDHVESRLLLRLLLEG